MRTKNTASEEALGELHRAVAESLSEDLKDPERRTPQLLSAAIKFLKDNNIECTREIPEHIRRAREVLVDPVKAAREDLDQIPLEI